MVMRIPTYEGIKQAPAVQVADTSAVGRAVRGLGQDIQQESAAWEERAAKLAKVRAEQKAKIDRSLALEKAIDYEVAIAKRQKDDKSARVGLNAYGYTDEIVQTSRKARDEFGQGLNPEALEFYKGLTDKTYTGDVEHASRWEADQYKVGQEATISRFGTKKVEDAGEYGTTGEEIDAQATEYGGMWQGLLGLDRDQTFGKVVEFKNKMARSAIDGAYNSGDDQKFVSQYDALKGHLTVEEQRKFQPEYQSKLEGILYGQALGAVSAKYPDSLKAYEYLVSNPEAPELKHLNPQSRAKAADELWQRQTRENQVKEREEREREERKAEQIKAAFRSGSTEQAEKMAYQMKNGAGLSLLSALRNEENSVDTKLQNSLFQAIDTGVVTTNSGVYDYISRNNGKGFGKVDTFTNYLNSKSKYGIAWSEGINNIRAINNKFFNDMKLPKKTREDFNVKVISRVIQDGVDPNDIAAVNTIRKEEAEKMPDTRGWFAQWFGIGDKPGRHYTENVPVEGVTVGKRGGASAVSPRISSRDAERLQAISKNNPDKLEAAKKEVDRLYGEGTADKVLSGN